VPSSSRGNRGSWEKFLQPKARVPRIFLDRRPQSSVTRQNKKRRRTRVYGPANHLASITEPSTGHIKELVRAESDGCFGNPSKPNDGRRCPTVHPGEEVQGDWKSNFPVVWMATRGGKESQPEE